MRTETLLSIDPDERSIADRFAAVARVVPDRIAVDTGDARWSYAETFAVANNVAEDLLDREIGQGDRVALLCDQGPAAFPALMGVLGAGAIAVPLVPDHPAVRLRQMAADAGLKALVVDPRHLELASAIVDDSCGVVPIDTARSTSTGTRRWPGGRTDLPALFMYTSGSTGTPKAVVLTHRQLLQKMALNARLFRTTPDDRFAMFGTYAVGQGMTVILSALLHGGAVCPFDVRTAGLTKLADWLAGHDISVYVSTLTLFRHLVRSVDRDRRFEGVRLVRVGGERVAASDVRAHRRLFGHSSRFLVSYSSTETGPITARETGPDDEIAEGFVPVGEPVEGVSVVVADEHGHVLAEGESGEIVVRSEFLSPGYWNDSERTARKYRTVPGQPSVREYRTGDEGRFSKGVLHYLGRLESRVKIRGFRVELEEVELRLRECSGVVQAAVVTSVQPDGGLGLIAYVQPGEGTRLSADELRRTLALRLPDHAVPSAFVRLEVLPLTDSGKPDRARLPEPSRDRLIVDAVGVQPRTALETTIADVWREVLGIQTGVLDAFLSVGGDSLKAAQVASRLSRVLGVDVAVGDLLDASTVEGIAALVTRLGGKLS